MLLLNLSQGMLSSYIRGAYALAMVCTFPLQLMPAVRLVEDNFFSPASNPPWARKCWKNMFRAAYVAFLALVALVGSSSLDHFISLAGAVCGIPLAFVFPSICHAGETPDA